jgi:hypothetical protein
VLSGETIIYLALFVLILPCKVTGVCRPVALISLFISGVSRLERSIVVKCSQHSSTAGYGSTWQPNNTTHGAGVELAPRAHLL